MPPPALLDPALLEAPHAFFAWLRQHAPVYPAGETRVFLVATRREVERALAESEPHSANLTGLLIRDAEGAPALFELHGVGEANAVLATADPPSHDVHRRLVQPVPRSLP